MSSYAAVNMFQQLMADGVDLSLLGNVLLRSDVASKLTVDSLVLLTRLLLSLREHIQWSCGSSLIGPPVHLPYHVQACLADILGLDLVIHYEIIPACWLALRQSVWRSSSPSSDTWRSKDLLDIFARYGPQHKLRAWSA